MGTAQNSNTCTPAARSARVVARHLGQLAVEQRLHCREFQEGFMNQPLTFLDDSQRAETCDLEGLFAALAEPDEPVSVSPGGRRSWAMLVAVVSVLLVAVALVATCWHL
jgi:hypothetical protein